MWQRYLPKKRRLVHSRICRQTQNSPWEIFQNTSGGRKLASRFPVPGPARSLFVPLNMTVDAWFDCWIQNIVGNLAPNTVRNYRERYKFNIQPIIGRMQPTDVKPMCCKIVLNQMGKDYAGGLWKLKESKEIGNPLSDTWVHRPTHRSKIHACYERSCLHQLENSQAGQEQFLWYPSV